MPSAAIRRLERDRRLVAAGFRDRPEWGGRRGRGGGTALKPKRQIAAPRVVFNAAKSS
jgi:hypothetical protein